MVNSPDIFQTRIEIERRSFYFLLLLGALPRLAFGGPAASAALAVIGWSAMALATSRAPDRIPRAIVHGALRARARAWTDRALSGLATAPVGCRAHSLLVPPSLRHGLPLR